jgi:hypothetical protein
LLDEEERALRVVGDCELFAGRELLLNGGLVDFHHFVTPFELLRSTAIRTLRQFAACAQLSSPLGGSSVIAATDIDLDQAIRRECSGAVSQRV